MNPTSCPSCGGRNLFEGPPVSAGGGHAPNYLPGLGTWWRSESFQLVICRDCGLTRFFASKEAREKLAEAPKWKRVP
jgi:predicted nucleic-acid-binding Zn-ribbon protein